MAKKKLFSGVKDYVKNTEYVKEQKPKTVSLGSSLQNTYKSSEPVQRQMSERERAEKERSNKMRSSALVSIAKTMAKNNVTKKTTLPSVAAKMRTQTKAQAPKTKVSSSIAHNALAPVSKYASTHRVTGGQGVGSSKPVLGYRKTQVLNPVKQDIKDNYYDAVRKVGMKGSRNERRVYRPLSERDENGQVSQNMRNLENRARGGNRKAQVEEALARTKAQTRTGHSYDEFVNAGINQSGLLPDYILRRKAPTEEELGYRKNYGFDEEAKQAVLDSANKRFLMGLDESYRASNLEDTLKRQYGTELTEDEQAKLDNARDSWAYAGGNMLGQASQFAMTAPASSLIEGGIMAKAGLKGGKAAIKTTKDALKFAGSRIAADQIVSAPINLLDAMKEDNGADIIKRFGYNQGLDIMFAGFSELPSFLKNRHFIKGKGINEAANAMEDGTRKLTAKVGAKKELDIAVDETGDVARQEAENIAMGRIGNQRPIANKIEAIQNAEGTVGEFPSTDYAYRIGGERANYDNMRDDMLGAIESQEAIGASEVPNSIGMRAEPTPYKSTRVEKTGVDKVLSDYNTSADILIARIQDPNFEDIQMLEDIADDLFTVGQRRSMQIDAERAYSDGVRAFSNNPEIDANAPRRAYMDVLKGNIVDELRRGQTPNAADDVARAVPAEKPKVEVSQEPKAETPKVESKASEADNKAQSVDDATKKLVDNWGNGAGDESYRNLVDSYKKMSEDELQREKSVLIKSAKDGKMDVDEVADRTDVIDAIIRDKKSDRSKEAWDEIEDIVEKNDEPKDLMREKPSRKENTIPKASDQKVKKEVFNRGESLGKNSTKETPKKRRQVKGVLNNEEPKAKPAERQKTDFDREDIREAERKSRELTNKEKKAAEKHGTHPYGEPKVIDGEETSKAGDTILSRKDSVLHEDVQLRGMEGVTNEGAGRKTTKKFNEALESAEERYKSDPHAFKERLRNARESVRKGEFPEGYTNKQDFFSDEAELQKQITKQLNSMEKGSDEYWELVDDAWEYAQDAIAGGSQAGGDLQQYKAFINAHPGVKAASIDKTLERLYKQFEKRLKKAGIDELKLPKEMRTAILTAETKEEASKAWADASIYVWRQIPASVKEKIDFLRINAMLLNPKTHIRNILGNAVFVPMRELKNLTGTGLEYIAEKAGIIDKAARTKAVIPDREAMKIAKDVRKNNPAIHGSSRLLENLANGRPLESGMTFMAGRQNGDPVINGIRKFLDKTGNANAWLLEHEDFLFFNGAFDRQFGRITKARGLTAEDLLNNPKLLDDVTEAATEEALRATYRDESAAARIISKWKNPPKNANAARKAAGLALDAILPFTKTPINILRRALDYSPAGAGKGIYHLARGMHDHNQKMIVRGLDQLASSIPGSGLAMLGWFMAENDRVTSKLGSDKDDQFMKDLGKQNFSIVFNAGTDDEWSYTVDWAAPGCIPFFTGVAFKQMSDEGVDFWETADAFEQMFEPMTEMSVMQGIKNTLETFQRESGGGVWQGLMSAGINTGLQYAGQFKPTLSGQIARTIDPVRRDTTSTADSATKRQIERWVNKQKASIPGLSKTLNPYQNVWGDEENNTYNEDLPMRIVENFFSPGYAKKYKADEVDKEILNIYKQDPSNTKVIPSKLNGYEIGFDGGTVRLSEEDRSNYIKKQGKVSKDVLRHLIKTNEYKNMSLSDKQKAYSKTYSDAGAEAKRDTLLKMGKDEWKVYTDDFSGGKKDYKAAKDAGIPAKTYFDIMTSYDKDADRNGNGSLYKSEAVLYLNSRKDLTDEQREILFPKMVTAKNPYTDGTAHTTDWEAEYEQKAAASEEKAGNDNGVKITSANPRAEGSIAAKAFKKAVLDNVVDSESSSSSKGSGSSKRGRSGRRGGGGSSKGSKRKQTASERKFANRSSKLSSVDLEKIYEQTKIKPTKLSSVDLAKIYSQVQKANKMKTPTYKDINVKGLTKSQKNALLKVMMKKIKA